MWFKDVWFRELSFREEKGNMDRCQLNGSTTNTHHDELLMDKVKERTRIRHVTPIHDSQVINLIVNVPACSKLKLQTRDL